MKKKTKETSRRSFIRAAAASGLVIGASGTSLAGCGGCPEDPPGNEHAEPPGHVKDEPEPGGEAHDSDMTDDHEKPGERIGHCKYDKDP